MRNSQDMQDEPVAEDARGFRVWEGDILDNLIWLQQTRSRRLSDRLSEPAETAGEAETL
ncbi:hypothetical protein [Streptomyces sp. NPDC001108]